MTIDELKNRVDAAINIFFANDSSLLDAKISEWAVAHRIAVYLENLFEGWNIDCEYNKVGLSGTTKHNGHGKYTRPDIIIHHRGMVEKEHNLLLIELKIKNTDEDDIKLSDFTSPPNYHRNFQYQYGLALSFTPQLMKKWFPEVSND